MVGKIAKIISQTSVRVFKNKDLVKLEAIALIMVGLKLLQQFINDNPKLLPS